jgi:hypothetical protein
MQPKITCAELVLDEPEEIEKGRLINMLIFYCTDCKKMITAADYESTDEIVDRLDEHLTFTYEGTSGVARRRLGDLRSFLEGERLADKIRLRSPVPKEFEKLSERIAKVKQQLP